jgi:hypothetical protein
MRNRPAVDASSEARAAIDAVLDRFGPGALRLAATAGVRFVQLHRSERYRDRSRTLRRLASTIDDWPVPPAGLFVVEERAVYLRSTSPMTVAHNLYAVLLVNRTPVHRTRRARAASCCMSSTTSASLRRRLLPTVRSGVGFRIGSSTSR